MNPREHELFALHPLQGEVQLSTGRAPTPYHVYDGRGLFVGGTADLRRVQALLAPEQVHAVQTRDGRALMALWIFDFGDASLGAHHELQVSLFVSAQKLAPVPSHRLSLLELMLTRPEVQMLCHGLWNDRAPVVAYNRELLALDAHLSQSRLTTEADVPSGERWSFQVHDAGTGAPLVEGHVRQPRRPSLQANLALALRLGWRRTMQLARQPWIAMPVLNPVGSVLRRNAAASTFTKAERSTLRPFHPAQDQLTMHEPRYAALGFEPGFWQSLEGFKFVYLFPR